jgi:hypothetical protein
LLRSSRMHSEECMKKCPGPTTRRTRKPNYQAHPRLQSRCPQRA